MNDFMKGFVAILLLVFMIPVAVYADPEKMRQVLHGEHREPTEPNPPRNYGMLCGMMLLGLFFWWTLFTGMFL